MRINLFSGAGAGKSTTAALLFGNLKKLHFDVELVTEKVKEWAYKHRIPTGYDQVFLFGSQLHREDLVWQAGYKHLVTDSPCVLSCVYAQYNSFDCWKQLLEIAQNYEAVHSSLNIFLERNNTPYQERGRFQNLDGAIQMDGEIKQFLKTNSIPFTSFMNNDFEGILDYVIKSLPQ